MDRLTRGGLHGRQKAAVGRSTHERVPLRRSRTRRWQHRAAGFDEQHTGVGVLAEAAGEYRTRCACTDDDEVVVLRLRHARSVSTDND